jgi:Chlorophyll A-B binding protein
MQTDTSQTDMQADTPQTDEQAADTLMTDEQADTPQTDEQAADTLMTDAQAGTLMTDTQTTPWTDKQDTLRTEMMGTAVRNAWAWGFTPQAEMWNGRLAMIGFLSAVLTELFANMGVLHFLGLLSSGTTPVV